MDVLSSALIIAGLSTAFYFFGRKKRVPIDRSTGKPLPHPFQLPIVGCLPFVSTDGLHYTFSEWARKLGKIFSCQMGPQQCIVINDLDLVREAFSKSSFSGRPQYHLFRLGYSLDEPESIGIIMSEGESWKEQRRFLLSTLKDFGIGKTSFQDVITDKSFNLLRTLEEHQGRPVDVRMMLNTAVSDVVSTVLFGQDYKHAETDFARYVDHVANAASELGGSALMNYWIWLRYLPYYSKIYHRLTRGMNFTFDVLRAIIENEKKSNPDNIVNNYIAAYFVKRNDTQSARFTDHNLMLTLSDIFGAGFETTGTTLRWALLYMCEYPELQKKLQAEIDREIGRERPPQVTDRDRLPWTEATLLEVQRIASVAPLGFPHKVMEDCELGDYLIPKDTVVFSNLYYIHHDPVNFPNPNQFQPQRFLDAGHSRIERTECLLPFSTGKRVCPGEALAKMELSLFFAALLQKFRFEFPQGAKADLRPRCGLTNDTKPYLLCAYPR
ncbi:hypothetical protein RvY_15721 [Ramazzottius varieornatus]|uniref:Cytochrome P450 n=1 Tax=Ramazzottius varieornatus TaxID=947166 RepID=A0A1D1VX24_RAMVA|nr:hypothetical protein RvY_15721 [Ramazzottius varieornatus]